MERVWGVAQGKMLPVRWFTSRSSHFKDQKYKNIRSELLLKGELFEDPHFPASNSSIGNIDSDNVTWKRPKDLCESPQLFVPGQTRNGVKAGKKSTPWIVSACAVLAGVPELCLRVVPESSAQEWKEDETSDYVGLFFFRFWHFGVWIDVVIDDRLPTNNNELLFTSSYHQGEFWIPLMEKAYAKLHGSYQGLEYGHLSDALVDFTGGVAEVRDIDRDDNDSSDQLCQLMETFVSELHNHSVICLRINVRAGDEAGERNELGLHRGDVYQVTGAKYIALGETRLKTLFSNKERIAMVRLRDTQPGPEGHSNLGCEGSPDSGKGSGTYVYSTNMLSRLLSRNPKWAQIKESERQRMGLTFQHSGEFWMPLDDMVVFDELTMVRFFTNNAFSLLQRWRESMFSGQWTQGLKGTASDRSGGCPEYQDTFLRNPQYALDVVGEEQMVVIQLLQWSGDERNKFVPDEQLPLLMGFCIIKVEENRTYRLNCQWDFCPTIVTVHPVRRRQLYFSGQLTSGRYILIPHTYRSGELGSFLLRTFAQRNIHLRLLKKDRPTRRWPGFIFKYPSLTTVVVVESANRLGEGKGTEAWVQLKCERKKGKTSVSHKSVHPSWNRAFLFYRAKPEVPISLKVFRSQWPFLRTLLGQAELPAVVNHRPSQLEVVLRDKQGEPTGSTLCLQILTTDNILCM